MSDAQDSNQPPSARDSKRPKDMLSLVLGVFLLLLVAMYMLDEAQTRALVAQEQRVNGLSLALLDANKQCQLKSVKAPGDSSALIACTGLSRTHIVGELARDARAAALFGEDALRTLYIRDAQATLACQGALSACEDHVLKDRAFFEQAKRRRTSRDD